MVARESPLAIGLGTRDSKSFNTFCRRKQSICDIELLSDPWQAESLALGLGCPQVARFSHKCWNSHLLRFFNQLSLAHLIQKVREVAQLCDPATCYEIDTHIFTHKFIIRR